MESRRIHVAYGLYLARNSRSLIISGQRIEGHKLRANFLEIDENSVSLGAAGAMSCTSAHAKLWEGQGLLVR